MCAIDFEGPKFIEITTPTARLPHRCCECHRQIDPGERYEVAAGRWDDFEVFKTCAHCVSARQWLEKECDAFIYGEVEMDLHQHAKEGKEPMRLYRYVAAMRRGWRRRDGRLMAVPL